MTDLSDTLAVLLRAGFSLAAVLGLVWFLARALRGSARRQTAGVVEVLGRTTVGRGASVAVLRVGARALVVGVSESGVRLLGEGDLASVAPAEAPAVPLVTTAQPADVLPPPGPGQRPATPAGGPRPGSILSPTTWRTALGSLDGLRERTVRRT